MKLFNSEEVPIPKYGEVLLFRNKQDGFIYYKIHNGNIKLPEFLNGIYFIPDRSIVRTINYTEDQLESTVISSGILIRFYTIPTIVVSGTGGGGQGAQGPQGAQGASGINYKIYNAKINQTGGSAPVASVITNTLSAIPVWSRSSAGMYLLTLAGEFPDVNKILVFDNGIAGAFSITNPGNTYTSATVFAQISSPNAISFTTFYQGHFPLDDLMQDMSLEIRIYP